MKKRQLSILLVAVTASAFAQYNFTPFGLSTAYNATLVSMRINGDSENIDTTFTGGWIETGSYDTYTVNRTTGNAAYLQTGDEEPTLTVYIDHAVSGWLCTVGQNSGGLSGTDVTVIADEDTDGFTSAYHALGGGDRSDTDKIGSWRIYGGTYTAGTQSSGFYGENMSVLYIEGASFYGGDGDTTAGSGILVDTTATSVTIVNGDDNEVMAGDYSSASVEDTTFAVGGSGVSVISSATISGGTYSGSQNLFGARTAEYEDVAVGDGADVYANGGQGIYVSGTATLSDLSAYGGDAGNAIVYGEDSSAVSSGGSGIYVVGGATITDVYAIGGSSAGSVVNKGTYLDSTAEDYYESANNSDAYANGGNGIRVTGSATLNNVTAIGTGGSTAQSYETNSVAIANGGHGFAGASTTINGGTFVGADGGTAVSRVGYAEASGGSGAYSTGNLTINGGTFTGGDGGKASADEGTVYSEGGAGAATYGTTLTINGGTFTGGAGGTVNGVKTLGNVGVRVTNGNLAITTNSAATVINGHIVFDNSASKSMSIAGATIGGNIYKYGAGTALITVDDTASYGGAFMQAEGSSQITLTSTNQGRFFSDVTVADGNMTFQGTAQLITSEDAQFTLGPSNTVLTLQQGARFSKGSGIDAGYSSIVSSGGSLTLAEDSAMSLLYDGYYDNKGSVNVSGSSFVMNDNAELSIMGVAAQPTNSLDFVSGGTVTVSTNATVKADLGWLVDEQINIGASSISVDTVYNSLTNTSLSDLGSGILLYVDSIILSTNVSFYDLNASGESKGDQLFRYTLSQLPDTGEASIQVSQQLHEQIAARGTEFRSMNGFASSKPTFGNSPVGVAGPVNKIDEEKTMQGWVRAYGGKGSRDADGTFAEYDSSSWGTVIGVDKSFGNLLVGLAGGYARTDLDAGSAYQSDIDTYHGSIYSTFGGESCFLDVALTYGWASTEEESTLVSGEFDSQMYSAYIGAGYAFELGEKLALTPEASFLASFYDQEEYTRDSILGNGTVQEYDTSSFLGSIGVNLATQHQIDWLNRGIAYIPEIRAHYIREFNADPDDFTYVLGGTSSSFAVRPRDEDLLRLGFGFDMWNWRYQNTKFEIDYDGLFSEKYYEHMVSGKVTWRF